MTAPFYFKDGRAMKCDGCDAPVGEKDGRFWDKESRKRFCVKCGKDRGGVEGGIVGGGVTTANKEDKVITNKPSVMCQNCGDSVNHVTHIISIGGRDIDMSICDRCEWLRRAAWQLKLNGMWKPTPKHEAIP